MKRIIEIIYVEKRINGEGHEFYLSHVKLNYGETEPEHDEVFTVPHSAFPRIGDEVEAFFDDRYGKPKAKYPA